MVAGRYRLEELIGSGGMGVVWRATDVQLGRVVAVKQATPGRGEQGAEQLHREATNAARVHDPHAVTLFDAVLDGAECWLIMEYFESTSLDRMLGQEEALPPNQVARIGAQIAAALVALHAKGIVHRDVKPGNILVAQDGTTKLTDFGISRWAEQTLTQTGPVAWTPAYGAPEVAAGKPATPASDVYSLGATLFAAVEGAPPDAENAAAPPVSSTEVSTTRRAGPLGPVLAELLRHAPKERPTADRVRDMLLEVGGEPTPLLQATSPDGSGKLRPPLHWAPLQWRRTAAVAGVGVAVLALVAGAITFINWTRSGSSTVATGGPLPAVWDPRSVDPCALTSAAGLGQFGPAELEPDYGNFNRCDVLVTVPDRALVDVQAQFKVEGSLSQNSSRENVPAGGLRVDRERPTNGACTRKVRLAAPVSFWVIAKTSDKTTADLCAIADTATNIAVGRLASGEIPRRSSPFETRSLANVDACALIEDEKLSQVPGLDVAHPEVGFGNWECRWNSTTAPMPLYVRFDRGKPLSAKDGRPARFGGREAVVKTNGDGAGTCKAEVDYRPYSDVNRHPAAEKLVLTVSGPQPTDQLCAITADLTESAAASLPR
jgi:eukaryotic-like serine/threonine-protein kinase